jgi:peroxiredoxin
MLGNGLMQEESIVAEAEKTRSVWKAFDPAYVILIIAVVVAIAYSVMVSRKNSALQTREREYSGTLCGPQTTQIGDIVPAFKTVDLPGRQAEVLYDGTRKSLFFIFSPMCSTCEHEVPLWNALVSIAASKKFTVRGISIDSLEDSRKNVIGKNISFVVLIMPGMPTRRAYRVASIPQVMIVSEHGTVEWVHYGAMTQEKVADLQSKLKEDR